MTSLEKFIVALLCIIFLPSHWQKFTRNYCRITYVRVLKRDLDQGIKCSDRSFVTSISARYGTVKLANGFVLRQFEINFSILDEAAPNESKIKIEDFVKYQYLPKSKFVLHSVHEKL